MNAKNSLISTAINPFTNLSKKSLKASLLSLALLSFSFSLTAQEENKPSDQKVSDTTQQTETLDVKEESKNYVPHKYEVGFRANSLSSRQLTFAVSTKENRMVRFRSMNMNIGLGANNNFNLGGGLAVGFQKYKPLKEDISFYHGFEPGLSYGFQRINENNFIINQNMLSARLGYMLGVSLDITENFKLYGEITPFIAADYIHQSGIVNSHVTRIQSDLNTFNFNFGLHYKF